MVCSEDTYRIETSQLFCNADRMAGFLSGTGIKWNLLDRSQS